MENELEPLAFWKARSFWFIIVSMGLTISRALGYEIMPYLSDWGIEDKNALVDLVYTYVPELLALLAIRERLNPRRRLALKG